MTLKPLIGRWLPRFMSTQYNRSYQRREAYQSDSNRPPLTVGSRPSRYPLREMQHDRDSWIQYPGKVDGIPYMADDVKINPETVESTGAETTDNVKPSRDLNTGDSISGDVTNNRLQLPQPSRSRATPSNVAGAFFDRHFDRRAISPTESERELRDPSRGPDSYDASSDKTDWVSERPVSIGQEHKWS